MVMADWSWDCEKEDLCPGTWTFPTFTLCLLHPHPAYPPPETPQHPAFVIFLNQVSFRGKICIESVFFLVGL